MARKQQWEKKAWEWALSIKPEQVERTHVKLAYRVTFKPCKPGTCKRNCRGNPNCLNHLGEAKWLTPSTDADPETEVEAQMRSGEGFVGLRNLGATCYVNSLLQVWYHNPIFRTAIFNFQRSNYSIRTEKTVSHPPSHFDAVYSTPSLPVSSEVNPHYQLLAEDPAGSSETEPPKNKKQKVSPSTSNVTTAVEKQGSDISLQGTAVPGDTVVESGIGTSLCGNGNNDIGMASSGGCLGGEEMEGLAEPVDVPAVVRQLQLLFTRLQHSNRSYIDPVEFIDSLSLQHDLQQDAQEFRKLFLSLLESAFQQQESPALQQLIPNLFGGTYAYVTRCDGCKAVSAMDSQFYELELNIKGHKMLSECLTEFFQQESLSDDNKYLCSRCGTKQDAKRFIRLKSLPPVLTLQLMRFVFDMSLFAKVKVTSYLIFPDTLDMSNYTGDTSAIYQLTAVIVHCGPSAYSGHYIAHVREPKSGSWFRFDDDVVERVKGDRLILGSYDDCYASSSSQTKKPRCPKGHHMSNNAYMLVYTRAGAMGDPGLPEPVAPSELQEVVAMDNSLFDQLLSETMEVKARTRSEAEAKRQEMELLYLGLGVGPGVESYDWLRTSCLMQWLAEEKPGSYRHEDLLCQHNKLSFDKVTELKRINSEIARRLYQQYNWDSPRITSDLLCRECVAERCRELHLQEKVATDQKIIAALLKTPCTSSSGFWVGKKSLQSWKRMVLQNGGFPHGYHSDKVTEPVNDAEHRGKESEANNSAVPVLDSNACNLCRGTQLAVSDVEQASSSNVPAGEGGNGTAVYSRTRGRKKAAKMDVISSSEPSSQLEPPKPTIASSVEVDLCESEQEVTSTSSTAPYDLEETDPGIVDRTGDRTNPDSNPPPNTRVSDTTITTPRLTKKKQMLTRTSSGPDCREAKSSAGEVMEASGCAAVMVESTSPPSGSGSDNKTVAEAKSSLLGELNGDLLCEHGDLCLSEGRRRLVPVEVWGILQGYFPHARSFPALHPPCPLCTQAKEGELEQLEVLKAVGQAQKNELLDLYYGRNRPSISEMDAVAEVYVIPASFVEEWIAFVRYPSRYEQPSSVSIATLLCEHGGFPFHITNKTWSDFSEHLVYVWPWEWQGLQQWYYNRNAITLTMTQLEDGGVVVESSPVYCEECHQLRVVVENSASDEFTTGYVYVFQAVEEDDELLSMVGMIEASTRSLRRRVPAGSKKIQISAIQTLQQLKLDVMYQFSVSPSDQRLFLKGVELEGPDKTLAELSVTPDSIIILRAGAEEHSYEKFVRETAAAAKDQIEGGFKGTGLLQ